MILLHTERITALCTALSVAEPSSSKLLLSAFPFRGILEPFVTTRVPLSVSEHETWLCWPFCLHMLNDFAKLRKLYIFGDTFWSSSVILQPVLMFSGQMPKGGFACIKDVEIEKVWNFSSNLSGYSDWRHCLRESWSSCRVVVSFRL